MSSQPALIERAPSPAPTVEVDTTLGAEALTVPSVAALDVVRNYLNGLAVRSQLGELTELEQVAAANMWAKQEPITPDEDELRWDVRRTADRLKDGQRVDERHLALWGLTTIVSRAAVAEHLRLTTVFAYRLRQPLQSGLERHSFLSEILPPRVAVPAPSE